MNRRAFLKGMGAAVLIAVPIIGANFSELVPAERQVYVEPWRGPRDDWPYLQGMLNTAAPGETVVVPARIYNINRTLHIPPGVSWHGADSRTVFEDRAVIRWHADPKGPPPVYMADLAPGGPGVMVVPGNPRIALRA